MTQEKTNPDPKKLTLDQETVRDLTKPAPPVEGARKPVGITDTCQSFADEQCDTK